MALRWRRQPRESGLAGVCQSPRGFELHDGKKIVIRVAPATSLYNRWEILGWYWYGQGQNTCDNLVATPEEAKVQAMAWLKSQQ